MTSSIVWDNSYGWLKALWSHAGQHFPLRLVRATRPYVPTIDAGRRLDGPMQVHFVSAVLDCGHIVRVPLERAERPGVPGKCHRFLPCYKCWLSAGNFLHAQCSFCGGMHPPEQACMRGLILG
ncbi:MAG TPA: hypothetical protein VFA98_06510 [Thermoanaerobaculia bacterium]|nr:hypothetical protein [Thermoanaerobaculia bacterium]